MKFLYITLVLSLLFSCGESEENQSEDFAHEITDTLQIDTLFEYDYNHCIKAWSLAEALAAPDSFCAVSISGYDKENKLTAIPADLAKLPYLRKLELSGNRITAIPEFLSELTELDMSSNLLKSFPTGLSNLTNLKELDLSYNQINKFDPAVFDLKNLERLSLYNNNLSALPKELFGLINLRQLDITGNPFDEFPEGFSKLINLESLDLSEMGVNDSTLTTSMKNLKSLKTLRMGAIYVNAGPGQGNELTYIPEWIFSLDSLEELSLDYGYISVVSENISKLKNLRSLNLEGNSLTELPKSLTKLSNLSSLYLGDNNFSEEEEAKIKSWFSDKVEVTFEPQNVGD